jgi:release factor glutamine methyltransferase
MTPEEAVRLLAAAGIANPRLDVRVLWEHAKRLSALESGSEAGNVANAAYLPCDPKKGGAAFPDLVARRARREPVAYITGKKEFWSLEFAVGPGVLIPRPETETLVECVLRAFPDRTGALSVLDLGTGTGCILAALLAEYPMAHGVGVESSASARRYAESNLERFGFANRCRIAAKNWNAAEGRFDVVVSNPPYIRSGDIPALESDVAIYEPPQALDGGPDGLSAYCALAPLIGRWLKPAGHAFLEIGAGQGGDIKHLLELAGLETEGIVADLAGIPRVVQVKIATIPTN